MNDHEKERKVLFNNVLKMFYLQLYQTYDYGQIS